LLRNEPKAFSKSFAISSHSPYHQVKFGIDATKLQTLFRGKRNVKYNRQLLDDFLQSASTVLKPDGVICVALCHGQGSIPVDAIQD
jgi:tRNA G10  N-methylase Trm11